MIKKTFFNSDIDISKIIEITDVYLGTVEGRQGYSLKYDVNCGGHLGKITHAVDLMHFVGENDFDETIKNDLFSGDLSQNEFMKKHGDDVMSKFRGIREDLILKWKHWKNR